MASTLAVDKIKTLSGVAIGWPAADGVANQVLGTDGIGQLSFRADSAGEVSKGSDIASADPLVITTGANYFICTGTTGFNDMTVGANRHFYLEFSGILTMTHNAGVLDLPSGLPIATAVGDVGEFYSTAANVVTCVNYTKVSGKPVKTDFIDADINASAAIALSKLASNPSSIGKATMWVPAVAMYPTTTTGCNALAQVEITAIKPEVKSLDFPVAADSYAQFGVAFPKSWDRLVLQYQTYWSVAGTNAGPVQFAMEAVAISNDDPYGANFGTVVPNTALPASGTADDLMVSAVSGDLTVGGTPLEGDQVIFQIYRDISGGNQTSDARLHGVKIFFTTSAENDN
tara:strand:+ start:190 stop:1221 length:1032 start_codon:yes stop_codon:yes gene_type:complete